MSYLLRIYVGLSFLILFISLKFGSTIGKTSYLTWRCSKSYFMPVLSMEMTYMFNLWFSTKCHEFKKSCQVRTFCSNSIFKFSLNYFSLPYNSHCSKVSGGVSGLPSYYKKATEFHCCVHLLWLCFPMCNWTSCVEAPI